jgi:hypothetical protein
MAHLQATRLYNKVASGAAAAAAADGGGGEQPADGAPAADAADGGEPGSQAAAAAGSPEQRAARRAAVAASLARVVHAHLCLLVDTEAAQSPTRASVWRAEQCLREWGELEAGGLAAGAAGLGEQQVCVGGGAVWAGGWGLSCTHAGKPGTRCTTCCTTCPPPAPSPPPAQVSLLRRWARTADADLSLAEALHGCPLHPSQRLQVGPAARQRQCAAAARCQASTLRLWQRSPARTLPLARPCAGAS